MKLHKNNNLAYHHIRGWIMVVGPGLARLDCTTNSDISTSSRGVFNKQTMSIVRPGLGETNTESTIRLKLIQSHQRNKQQGLDGCGPDSVDAVISLAVVLTRSLSVMGRACFRSAHYLITGTTLLTILRPRDTESAVTLHSDCSPPLD